MSSLNDLGVCPTGEHISHPQCGFIGCVDLRPWAKANRYRYRLEESYDAENNAHVRGDGRWFVEVLCQRGIIYPAGGIDLAAYTTSRSAWQDLLAVDGISKPQQGHKEYRLRFPLSQLEAVAAIMKPRKRRTVVLTPEQIEFRRETLAKARQAKKSLSPEAKNGVITAAKSAGEVPPRVTLPCA